MFYEYPSVTGANSPNSHLEYLKALSGTIPSVFYADDEYSSG